MTRLICTASGFATMLVTTTSTLRSRASTSTRTMIRKTNLAANIAGSSWCEIQAVDWCEYQLKGEAPRMPACASALLTRAIFRSAFFPVGLRTHIILFVRFSLHGKVGRNLLRGCKEHLRQQLQRVLGGRMSSLSRESERLDSRPRMLGALRKGDNFTLAAWESGEKGFEGFRRCQASPAAGH